MVRQVKVVLSEEDYERLNEVKGDNRTWLEALKEEFGVDDD